LIYIGGDLWFLFIEKKKSVIDERKYLFFQDPLSASVLLASPRIKSEAENSDN